MTTEITRLSVSRTLLVVLVVLPWINPFADWPVPALKPLLVVATCIALMAIVMALSRVSRRVLWSAACTGWVIAAALNTVFALLQYFHLDGSLHPWVSATPPDQVFGNLRQRNLFATSCAMALAVLVWNGRGADDNSALRGGGQYDFTRTGPIAVLLGVGLAISGSRTGMVELALLWALAWMWSQTAAQSLSTWSTLRTLIWATVAYGATLAFALLDGSELPSAATRLVASGAIDACQTRKVIWANILQLIMQKPWLGWGWGEVSYAQFMTLIDGPRACGVIDNAHNLPLHLAVTLGVPIATIILVILSYWTYRAQPWRAPDAQQQLAWSILTLVGFHSLIEYPLWDNAFRFTVLLCVWYLYGCRRQSQVAQEWLQAWVAKTVAARALFLLLGALVIVACAFMAESYSRVQLLFIPPNARPAEFSKSIPLNRRDVMLFTNQVSFASLSMELTPENAQQSLDLAMNLLHGEIGAFAIERVIASLIMLGRQEEAHFYEVRYAASLPEEYAKWVAAGRKSDFFEYNSKH